MFEVRAVALAPGRELPYDRAYWLDSLVLLERGEVELVCLGGERRRFVAGNVLCLTEVPLRALHNRGSDPALLVAVSRRR
jgi:hypothetical protein